MDGSVIIVDEVIVVDETSFNEKNITCKTQKIYILLTFSFITIFIIDFPIYCYLIKYRAKDLLPFHDTKIKTNLY